MYDVRDEDELQQWKDSKNPWTSPGSAPVFGNGCGAAGGAPYGCLCKEDTPLNECFGDDDRPYGSCCGAPSADVSHETVCAIVQFGSLSTNFRVIHNAQVIPGARMSQSMQQMEFMMVQPLLCGNGVVQQQLSGSLELNTEVSLSKLTP